MHASSADPRNQLKHLASSLFSQASAQPSSDKVFISIINFLLLILVTSVFCFLAYNTWHGLVLLDSCSRGDGTPGMGGGGGYLGNQE